MKRASQAQPGDIVSWWHDTGCFGQAVCYGRVVRVGSATVTFDSEFGHRAVRRRFDFFTRGVIEGPEAEDAVEILAKS